MGLRLNSPLARFCKCIAIPSASSPSLTILSTSSLKVDDLLLLPNLYIVIWRKKTKSGLLFVYPRQKSYLRASQKNICPLHRVLDYCFLTSSPQSKAVFAPRCCQTDDEWPQTCLLRGISILSRESQVADLTRNMREEKLHAQLMLLQKVFFWAYIPV